MRVVLDEGAYMPVRAHELDAGYDIFTPIDICIDGVEMVSVVDDNYSCVKETYPCIDSVSIDTGVHIEIPEGYVGFLKSKSGLNVNNGIIGEGVIDAGYTGSIRVKLYNLSDKPHEFKRGDKIIQLVILPILTPELEEVDRLGDTERGSAGFGSTGK